MTTKAKNRCTVTLKQKYVHIGTYRPTQEIFYEIQKELEPYRILYNKVIKSEKIYTVILKQEDIKMGSYKISSEMFNLLMEKIKPFRSLQEQSKKVRCIETGEIFKNVRAASNWVAFVRENYYCDMNLIRQACKGKQKTSYGYHWEFVENTIEVIK